MPHPLTKIGIISKHEIAASQKVQLKKLLVFLQKTGKKILLDQNIAALVSAKGGIADKLVFSKQGQNNAGKKGFSRTQLLQTCDLILTLGGDGTVLKTAGCMPIPKSTANQLLPTHHPLILGVNFGNLGFLTESSPKTFIHDLAKIFKGQYTVDERALLQITHLRLGKIINTFLALNDAVINQGSFARLIEMGVDIDQKRILTFKADGLIMASPTGSTGHSLSAGGPIVHPSIPAFVLTPICPATISIRPILVPNTNEISITLTTQRQEKQNVGLTIDGQMTVPIHYGDEIRVCQSSRTFAMIRLHGGSSYYHMLRTKLHWGGHEN